MRCKYKLLLILMFTLFMVTACIPGNGVNNPDNKAGFFWGIWHGWMAPISLLIRIFVKNAGLRIYEVHNTGFFYDLGYYIAIVSGFGSISLTRSRKRK